MFAKVFLNAKEEREILQGFPWVFDNEISHFKHRADEKSEWKNETLAECTVPDGSAVEVCTKAGGFLGSGILNKKSKIAVRLISTEHVDKVFEDISDFWEKRILAAYNHRKLYYSDTDSYRLVFGEADLIPGFICERFCSEDGKVFLVVQFLAMACEVFREEILKALKKVCKPDGIFEKDDEAVREKEGLPLTSGWLDGKNFDTKITIIENEVRLCVDVEGGQKTGYFLDQKFNREQIKRFCHGKKVLDTFTHTGAFGLNAFKAGAREVTSVDISEEAVEMVNNNIKLNKAEKVMKAVCADVFDLLKKYEADGEKFDVIILDPPAFTKSAKNIQKAYGGYKEINLRAMRLLNEGGILITCSCSHFFDSTTFYDMIMHAAMDSHKKVQILDKRGAGPDHPLLAGYPKSEYLKCAICVVR
ncbi:putative SAM-dependent methyltransferase [Treponema sp. JC4]|uniref:class I SAM-dependent rRNA methyltransferase n=1 Tax=Treponema sp. JC4 TaxID=1124982 RepID=UPI00025B0C1F|nr:class I SAM-dependent rRNA methyltransferase [Treponema sp. JC4]EID85474.1 putative SAM-dependent methyltransferase [Treponema sp. JC4]